MSRISLSTTAALAALLLCGCAAGPDYVVPSTDVPASFKEAATPDNWKQASPRLAESGDVWAQSFHDSVLDALLKEARANNQDLQAAQASLREARAALDEARAALFPTLDLSGSALRSGTGSGKGNAQTAHKIALGASWEPDLWGGTRRSVEGDEASAESAEASLAATRLSTDSAVASALINLRAADSQINLLQQTVAAYDKALTIARNQYEAGLTSSADADTAKTQLENAKASLVAARLSRSKAEHALAVLIGKPPAALTMASLPLAGDPPLVPAQLPSFLLERRPDIAAAERAVQAANAQIGVGKAAYFPSLTLSGSAGYSAIALSKVLQASSGVWSFGPSLAATLFDGGARAARVEQAEAATEKAAATYRQTVLDAFREVEDLLASQRYYLDQEGPVQAALAAAERAETQSLRQYEAGLTSYSAVATAQIARLQAAEAAVTLKQNRFLASVSLIAALGGGWENPFHGQ